MTTSITTLMYALMDSNFDNIKSNIDAVKKIWVESDQVVHRICFSFDANEMDVWLKQVYFDFYNNKGEMVYSYSKPAQWIGRSLNHAKHNYEETKKRYPLAIVEWEDSKYAIYP